MINIGWCWAINNINNTNNSDSTVGLTIPVQELVTVVCSYAKLHVIVTDL